jgi:hypothetical protein
LNLVERHRKEVRLTEQAVQFQKDEWRCKRDDTLVLDAARDSIELARVDSSDVAYALITGEPSDCLQARHWTFVHEHLRNCIAMDANRLTDRLQACD